MNISLNVLSDFLFDQNNQQGRTKTADNVQLTHQVKSAW